MWNLAILSYRQALSWRCAWSPLTSAMEKTSMSRRKVWQWATSLCCSGQPVHGVLWGAGTGDSTSQTQAVEEVCRWHFLHPQEGLNWRTPHHLNGVRPTIKFTAKKMWRSCSLTCFSGEERIATWMSLSTGNPCTLTSISTLNPDHSTHVKRGVVRCLKTGLEGSSTTTITVYYHILTSKLYSHRVIPPIAIAIESRYTQSGASLALICACSSSAICSW